MSVWRAAAGPHLAAPIGAFLRAAAAYAANGFVFRSCFSDLLQRCRQRKTARALGPWAVFLGACPRQSGREGRGVLGAYLAACLATRLGSFSLMRALLPLRSRR